MMKLIMQDKIYHKFYGAVEHKNKILIQISHNNKRLDVKISESYKNEIGNFALSGIKPLTPRWDFP